MRRFCVYILLITLTMQSFYRSLMVLEYQVHLPEYLAKCINKDAPQLHCNGQCALMEKIKAKEKDETEKNRVAYEYSVLYTLTSQIPFAIEHLPTLVAKQCFVDHQSDYVFNYHNNIFHPPLG